MPERQWEMNDVPKPRERDIGLDEHRSQVFV